MTKEQVRIAEISSLKPGQMLRVMTKDTAILLANVEGEIYAIADQCSHEDASLYNGALKGDCVECPLHSSRFDLKTGMPREKPATEPVTTYPVRLDGDGIYITL